MHGSLKDYLKSVRSGKLLQPKLLLQQQQQQLRQVPPITPPIITSTVKLHMPTCNGNALMGASASDTTSPMYPATNQLSMLSLCPYHYNQLTQHNHSNRMSSSAPAREAPSNQHHHICPAAGAQAAEESASLYNIDPASKAHAMRLLRLLNSEYSLGEGTDNHNCCHSHTQDGAAIESRQSYSYSGLGEMCVRRACLDDYPDWYGAMPPNNYYYNYCKHCSYTYYNYPKQQEDSLFLETCKNHSSAYPPQPPPIYTNICGGKGGTIFSDAPQQKCSVCHGQLSPDLNLYYNSNPSSPTSCIYCCQHVDGEASGRDVCQQTGAVVGDKARMSGAGLNMMISTSYDDTETQLSYFEVLDFALQIARGMEHLERMKVSKSNGTVSLSITYVYCPF